MNNNLKLQKRALLLFLAALTPPIFSTQSEVILNEEELSEQEDLDEEDDFDDNEDENNDEAEKASKLAIVKHLVKKYGLPSAVVAALMTGSFFAGKSSGSKKSVAAPVNVAGKDFATTLLTLKEEATKVSTDKLVKEEAYSYITEELITETYLGYVTRQTTISTRHEASFFVPNHAQTTPAPVGWFKKAEPTLHDKGVTEIDKTFNELVAIVDAKIARGQDILKSLNSDLYNADYTTLFELENEVIQDLRTIAINFDLSGKSLEASVSKLNNLNTEFAQSIDAVIKAKFAKDSAFANQELFEVNAQAKDKAINLQQWPAVINNRISSLRQDIKMVEAARKQEAKEAKEVEAAKKATKEMGKKVAEEAAKKAKEQEAARLAQQQEADRLAQQQQAERARIEAAIEKLKNLSSKKDLEPTLTCLGASEEIKKAAELLSTNPSDTILAHLERDGNGTVIFKPGLVEALNKLKRAPQATVPLPNLEQEEGSGRLNLDRDLDDFIKIASKNKANLDFVNALTTAQAKNIFSSGWEKAQLIATQIANAIDDSTLVKLKGILLKEESGVVIVNNNITTAKLPFICVELTGKIDLPA